MYSVAWPKPRAAVELTALVVTPVVPSSSIIVHAFTLLLVAVTETALPRVR